MAKVASVKSRTGLTITISSDTTEISCPRKTTSAITVSAYVHYI